MKEGGGEAHRGGGTSVGGYSWQRSRGERQWQEATAERAATAGGSIIRVGGRRRRWCGVGGERKPLEGRLTIWMGEDAAERGSVEMGEVSESV